jgi:hypothetical protein
MCQRVPISRMVGLHRMPLTMVKKTARARNPSPAVRDFQLHRDLLYEVMGGGGGCGCKRALLGHTKSNTSPMGSESLQQYLLCSSADRGSNRCGKLTVISIEGRFLGHRQFGFQQEM